MSSSFDEIKGTLLSLYYSLKFYWSVLSPILDIIGYIVFGIIILFVLIDIYQKRKNRKMPEEEVEEGIKYIEKVAGSNIKSVMSTSNSLEAFEPYEHFNKLRQTLKVTENHYYRLKQRYARQHEKLIEIANDWSGYTDALWEIMHARDILNVDDAPNSFDKFGSRIRAPMEIKEEVEKKFNALLGIETRELTEFTDRLYEHF